MEGAVGKRAGPRVVVVPAGFERRLQVLGLGQGTDLVGLAHDVLGRAKGKLGFVGVRHVLEERVVDVAQIRVGLYEEQATRISGHG